MLLVVCCRKLGVRHWLILGEIWGRGECLAWFCAEGGLNARYNILARHNNDIGKRQSVYISDAYARGAGDSEKRGISTMRAYAVCRAGVAKGDFKTLYFRG